MAKTIKYLEGLTIHKVPYNIANTDNFRDNVMADAADNELFIITDTPTFSLKIGNVTYDGTSNVSVTPKDLGLKKLTIGDKEYNGTNAISIAAATNSASGLMSASDKKKLDGIATGATKITVDTSLSSTSTNPVQNKVINSALSGKAGTSVATTNTNGLMSAADKTKLNGIATGANKTTVDSSLSTSSTNPVQNKVIKSALDGKLSTSGGTLTGNLTGKYITGTWLQTTAATDLGRTPGKIVILDESGWVYYRTPAEIKSDIGADIAVATTNSDGLMSASDKSKLNDIASGATKTIIDSTLSSTSTNPVQNKVVKAALDDKLDKKGNLNITGSITASENIGSLTSISAETVNCGGVNATGEVIAAKLNARDAVDLGRIPGKIAVLDDSGGVYYRTPAEIKSDIGADGYLPTAGGTMTGAITTKGIKLTSGTDYGSSLPSSLQSNQLFFQTLGSNYILDNVYPVGSIYMSVNSTNPTNLFGGTWEQIQGKFLFGMNSSYPAGSTGGEITHTLTANEMPTHAHYMASGNGGGDGTWEPDAGYYLLDSVTTDKTTYWAQIGMNNAGGSAAHNNMPPYLSVYIWKRTK